MRGKKHLDEVAGMYHNTPRIRFRQGKKTIITVNLHDDHYKFSLLSVKQKEKSFYLMFHINMEIDSY